jgi:hypothetical protein
MVHIMGYSSTWWFLPAMPPNTVSGIVIALHMSMMITMVPNGSAAVDCHANAGTINVSCMVRSLGQ